MQVKLKEGDLKAVYRAFDVNGDRKIDYAEFLNVIKTDTRRPLSTRLSDDRRPPPVDDPYVIRMIEKLLAEIQGSTTRLFEVLQRMDRNNNGLLSYTEMHRALADFKVRVSFGDLRGVMEAFDRNGDNHVDYLEFYSMLRHHEQQMESAYPDGRRSSGWDIDARSVGSRRSAALRSTAKLSATAPAPAAAPAAPSDITNRSYPSRMTDGSAAGWGWRDSPEVCDILERMVADLRWNAEQFPRALTRADRGRLGGVSMEDLQKASAELGAHLSTSDAQLLANTFIKRGTESLIDYHILYGALSSFIWK
jgi:Ca2+-binding EF-hand superfamily protein